jgi:RNA polymerase sigma factor (sigma-70 family)
MRGDTAIKSFTRSKFKIRIMLLKLMQQTGFSCSLDELISETQEKWIVCFEQYYEEDDQFLKFMFIVMKNKLRDLRNKEFRYQNTHISCPTSIAKMFPIIDTEVSGYVRVWNEMAADHKEENPLDIIIKKDIINQVNKKLIKDLERKVFIRLVEGASPKQIANDLGYSIGHIGQIRNKRIWPVVKEVMNIPDDKYDMLIDSGRIYS